jgi:hypothetical protein
MLDGQARHDFFSRPGRPVRAGIRFRPPLGYPQIYRDGDRVREVRRLRCPLAFDAPGRMATALSTVGIPASRPVRFSAGPVLIEITPAGGTRCYLVLAHVGAI